MTDREYREIIRGAVSPVDFKAMREVCKHGGHQPEGRVVKTAKGLRCVGRCAICGIGFAHDGSPSVAPTDPAED